LITGSLQIKKDFYYAVLNLKDVKGNRKLKWISTKLPVKGNKRQAEKFLRDKINEYENKIVDYASNGLFADYILEWLNSRKGKIELNTWDSYASVVISSASPYFKDRKIKLQNLTAFDLEKYYETLTERGCSANTVKHHHANIRHCLNKALKEKLVQYNVALAVELPKDDKIYVPKYYDDIQAKKLLEVAKGTIDETYLLLAIYYGLRRSEIAGLVWENIDFEKKLIHIGQKRVKFGKSDDYVSKKNKTKSSTATLPLIEVVYSHLKKLRVKQKENQLYFGNAYHIEEHDFICRKPNGKRLKLGYMSESIKKYAPRAGLPIIEFKNLRHSCGSMLVNAGMDIKFVQEWLRHSDISTTSRFYVRVNMQSKLETASAIEKALSVEC